MDREAAPLRADRKQAQKEILALFPKAVLVEDQRLVGFNNILSWRTMLTWPIHEEEPIAKRLREIGLDRFDAHHVMVAIQNG